MSKTTINDLQESLLPKYHEPEWPSPTIIYDKPPSIRTVLNGFYLLPCHLLGWKDSKPKKGK